MLQKGFHEWFRVLMPGGFLVFKWSEINIPVSKILSLTDKKPILEHRSGKASKTHWILFMKKQDMATSNAVGMFKALVEMYGIDDCR